MKETTVDCLIRYYEEKRFDILSRIMQVAFDSMSYKEMKIENCSEILDSQNQKRFQILIRDNSE